MVSKKLGLIYFVFILGLFCLSGVSALPSNPSINLIYPADSQNYSDTITSVIWSFSNDSEVFCWYSLNNGISYNPVDCSLQTIAGFSSTEGVNNWKVKINNSIGTEHISSSSFWVDSIAPVLDYVNPVTQISYTNQDSFNFQFWLNETNKGTYPGPKFAPFYLKVYDAWSNNFYSPNLINLSNADESNSELKNIVIPEGNLGEGDYNYIVYAKDIYPNGTTIREINLTGTIVRDTIKPSVTITSPINYQNLSGNFTVSTSATDDRSGIQLISLNISNGVLSNFTECLSSESCGLNWFSAEFSDGQVNITANSSDRAGNFNTTQVTIEIDNTNPQINFVSPSATGSYNFTQLVNITASDVHLSEIELYVNGVFNSSINQNEINLVLGEGNWSVYAIAEDSFGNENISETRNILVDLTAPNLSLSGDNPQIIELGDSYAELGAIANDNFDGNVTSSITINSSAVNTTKVGSYNVSYFVNDSVNNIEMKNRTVIVSDTTAPTIAITSPSPDNNKVYVNGTTITFHVNEADPSGVNNCFLTLNSQIYSMAPLSSWATSIEFVTANRYYWNVTCNDTFGNSDTTETRTFTILAPESEASEFTDFTNLSNASDITGVPNFFVKNTFGSVNFTEAIDFSSGFDWSQFINISDNRIEINSTGAPALNRPAVITFYNITSTTPRIIKNGTVCESPSCNIISFVGGTLVFNVTGFSVYTSEETPVSSSSSGGGSLSGHECTTDWTCGSWSSCNSGTQTRTCLKVNTNCDAGDKPLESQACSSVDSGSNSSNQEETIEQSSDESTGSGITGAAINAGTVKSIIGVILFIAMVAIVYLIVRAKRKHKHPFQNNIKMIKQSSPEIVDVKDFE